MVRAPDEAPAGVPLRCGRLSRAPGRGDGRCGAHSAAARSRRCGLGRRRLGRCRRDLCASAGPEHVLCLRLPERDIGGASSDLGLELATALGTQDGRGAHHRCARGARLLPAARRGHPARLPRVRAGVAAQARALGSDGRDDRLLARGRAPGRDRGSPSHACRCIPRADLRDQHEATCSQAPRVHVGRPPRLRGHQAPRTCSSTTRGSSSRAATDWPT